MTKEELLNIQHSGSQIQIVNPWKSTVNSEFDCDEFNFNAKKDIILPPQNLKLQELKYIIDDILAGDQSAVSRPEFACLNFNLIKQAIDWLGNTNDLTDNTKANLIMQPWRLNFKDYPPTPEEFLTEKYVGTLAETIYPHIRTWFCDMLDPTKPYRDAMLCSFIGSGKSYITNLLNLYVAVHYALMYSPHRFFGLSPATVFVLAFGSFSQKKASEIYTEPLLQILESCTFFEKVRTHEALHKKDLEMTETNLVEKVYYTTATPTSSMQFSNNLNIKTISSANQIIGMTMITFALTEISFFYENGWTDEQIMRLYTKGKQRISSRLHGNYYGRTILDSSPGSLENKIDQYVWQDAPKSKLNFIASGARWSIIKDDYPDFYDENKNPKNNDWTVGFPLYKGGNGKIPQVVNNENELALHDPADIMWIPLRSRYNEDLLEQAAENPLEFMRDFGGVPAGMQERIFYDQTVLDKVFDNNLKNIDIVLSADSMAEPEHLIWDQVKETLFYKVIDRYYFHYKPELARAIAVDQSYAEDICAIAMSHVERDPIRKDPETGEDLVLYVTDFTINLHRGPNAQINLDAIRYFIMDLVLLGQMPVRAVAFDNFQSIPTRQALKRFGLDVDYVSMDKTNQPYLTFIDLIFKKRYFCGKNTILKNNLKSIQMVKRNNAKGTFKVDHTKGEVPLVGDDAGRNAKDCSDAVGASVYELTLHPEKFVPYSTWNPEIIERTYDSVLSNTKAVMKELGFSM